MQTRATLALSMHMDYLQIEKYRLAVLFFLMLFLLFPPEMSLPLCNQHSTTQTRISPHIADVVRTIKAVLKTFSH